MQGVIATGGRRTVEAGALMLKQGGNAVDAAVAAAFVSFIAEIGIVHWGGSGIAHIYDPLTQQSIIYDFFSNMPGLGREAPPKKLDFHGFTVDFGATTQDFWIGRGSVAVPGNIIGLCQLAADWGNLPLAMLLQPAIELAEHGHPIESFQAATCRLLQPLLTQTRSSRAIFAPNGSIIQSQERLFIPHLAHTLHQLAEEGADLMRNGALAEAIVRDQQANNGLITAEDLTNYDVFVREPLRVMYRDFEVLLPPPCSVGGLLVGFTLKLLARFDVGRMGVFSAESYQLFYEAMEATLRARQRWERAVKRQGTVSAIEATLINEFLSDDFVQSYADEVQSALHNKHPFAPPQHEKKGPNNTGHLSVMDGNGMAVSITTTAGESAGFVVPNTGIILNNMLGEADLNPHGWHQWTPGQRMPTMMTPTILLKHGDVQMVIGSGGSARIRSAIVQVISSYVDHGMSLREAVEMPRLHTEDGILQCEGGYDEHAAAQLEAWGYPLNRWQHPSIYFGGAHAVGRDAQHNLIGAGDPRRDGHIAVVTKTKTDKST